MRIILKPKYILSIKFIADRSDEINQRFNMSWESQSMKKNGKKYWLTVNFLNYNKENKYLIKQN